MIHHVTFEVAPGEAEACLAFYGLLGFTEVERPEKITARATWLERAGTQIHLLETEDPTQLPAGHVAVVVEDFERTFAALDAAGHDPDRRREHWGSPRAFVRDPAGNRVEMMAFPPAPAAGA